MTRESRTIYRYPRTTYRYTKETIRNAIGVGCTFCGASSLQRCSYTEINGELSYYDIPHETRILTYLGLKEAEDA